jgi:hypothetical protein
MPKPGETTVAFACLAGFFLITAQDRAFVYNLISGSFPEVLSALYRPRRVLSFSTGKRCRPW